MTDNFDYTQVPGNYVHCLHTSCPRSAQCLRFQVTQHATIVKFTTINPRYLIGKEDTCRYFQENRLSIFALGITHLFDNLTYAQGVKIRKKIYFALNRSTFYRIQRKERLISPDEISLIRQIFEQEDIKEEPRFDEYIEKYNWERAH